MNEDPKPVLVLHSTEGWSIQDAVTTMTQRNTQAHIVFDPERNEREMLLDWDDWARSLQNLRGDEDLGVETNRRGKVYQVEIVGFAIKMPDYSDEWYDNLAAFVRDICEELEVPLDFPYDFVPYATHPPSSYGSNNGVRLSAEEWEEVTGIVGHMHVPENDHGDPGDIRPLIARLQPGREEISIRPLNPGLMYSFSSNSGDPEVLAFQKLYQQAPVTYMGKLDGDFGPLSLQATESMRTVRMGLQAQVDSLASQLTAAEATIAELESRLTARTEGESAIEASLRQELAEVRDNLRVANAHIAEQAAARTLTFTEEQLSLAAQRSEWFNRYLQALVQGSVLLAPSSVPETLD